MIAFLLTIVGGLNWGLVGLLNFNIVSTVLGMGSSLERLVYILVGGSAAWLLATHMNDCKICSSKAKK